MSRLRLLGDRFPGQPLLDTAVSRALLQGVAEGRLPATLRIYQPDDVLAFSILDRTAQGFAAATRIAGEQGFEPVLRLAGGRAAVFHTGTLAFAWSRPVGELRDGIEARYEEMAAILVAALTSLGADARVGEVPGEYCPGRFSVNAGGRLKLAGVGQRVVRGAAHVGGVIVVSGADRVKGVLTPVYRVLGEPFVPETTGAVDDVVPEVTLCDVADALRAAFEARYEVDASEVDAETLARAETLAPEHIPAPRASETAVRPLRDVPKGVMESS
jgi:lipoate-protein ligase A